MRARMIVSERGFNPSFLSPWRRSDPAIMIVWGLLLTSGVSSLPVPPCSGLNFSTVRSKNSSAVDVVAPAAMTTITKAPISDFLSNAQVGFHLVGDALHEVHEGTAIALQGFHRDPFGGAVVSSPDGAEL